MSRNTNLSAAKNAKNDEFRADVIVTNPPFSLFRGFLAWIVEGEKEGEVFGRGDRESVEKEGVGLAAKYAKSAKGFSKQTKQEVITPNSCRPDNQLSEGDEP